MHSENIYFDNRAEKHIAKQLLSCCCFIIDKRHFFVATVIVFFHFANLRFQEVEEGRHLG